MPTSHDPEPAPPQPNRRPAAPGTPRGQCQRDLTTQNVHTLKQKPPLRGGMPCPRWDSNHIPVLENTGKSRKHAEYGPVRPMYDPIRRQRCAHCAHRFLAVELPHRPQNQESRTEAPSQPLRDRPIRGPAVRSDRLLPRCHHRRHVPRPRSIILNTWPTAPVEACRSRPRQQGWPGHRTEHGLAAEQHEPVHVFHHDGDLVGDDAKLALERPRQLCFVTTRLVGGGAPCGGF